MRRTFKNRNLRRGATVVEVACVAPVLLLMMLLFLEGGYAFMVKQTITLAANRAARVAILPGYTAADVEASVDESMRMAGITGYTVTTNLDELGPADPSVWVDISIPVERILFTGKLMGGKTMMMSSRKVAQREIDRNLVNDD